MLWRWMRSGGTAPQFLTSALDGGERSDSYTCRFKPSDRAPSTHWIGGRSGHSDSLDAAPAGKLNIISWFSSVGIVIELPNGWRGKSWILFLFPLSIASGTVICSFDPLSNWNRCSIFLWCWGWSVQLTTKLHLVLKSIMCGATWPCPHTSSWRCTWLRRNFQTPFVMPFIDNDFVQFSVPFKTSNSKL
jgi:hypothetical protein